jgi:hypothetical protein
VAYAKVLGVYVGLMTRPLRFAVHKRLAPLRETVEVYRQATYPEFVGKLIEVLAQESPGFMQRFAELDDKKFMASPHKTRRYIAERRDLLYINAPHLTARHSAQLLGYWYVTNIGRPEVGAIAGLACEAAGVPRNSISNLKL